ncbi:MAG: hypothetical protein KJT03_02155 [Verrucomicrobiae bacterium]|nr:hypothetical protein [Verrucomicrobiae bacterium]
MKENQYTIRRVPAHLDEALRRKAKRKGQSLNQVLLDTLAESVGEDAARYHDLDPLAGTWKTDKAFDDAVKAFDKVDPDDWK